MEATAHENPEIQPEWYIELADTLQELAKTAAELVETAEGLREGLDSRHNFMVCLAALQTFLSSLPEPEPYTDDTMECTQDLCCRLTDALQRMRKVFEGDEEEWIKLNAPSLRFWKWVPPSSPSEHL